MATAAAEPAVPGAAGEYPHPNHVAKSLANETRAELEGAVVKAEVYLCIIAPRSPVNASTVLGINSLQNVHSALEAIKLGQRRSWRRFVRDGRRS